MKKIFTLIAVAMVAATTFAQNDVVVLSTETYDETTSDDNTYHFTGTDITMNMNNRAFKKLERQGWDLGINLKNNQKYDIVLPAGIKLYGIAMSGYSQGSNWEYLYGYGVGDNNGYEWTDPIGNAEKNNITISTTAKYPIDPCEVIYEDESQGHTEHNNVAGYTFAKISFGDEPYEGLFSVHFCGNNQLDVMFTLYLSKEAADAGLGGTDGITAVKTIGTYDNARYNLAGQQVTKAYKGVVIQNGKKFVQK